MYISRVELKNIRGVGAEGLSVDFATPAFAAERKSLAGWSVIAGPNGAGKTTLLQAMAASLLGGSGSNWLFRPEDRLDWIHREGTTESMEDRGTTCTSVEGVVDDDEMPQRKRRVSPVRLCIEWPRDPSSVKEITPKGESAVMKHFWHAAAYGARPNGWLFAGYGPHRGNRQSSPDAVSLFKTAPRTAAVVTLFRQDAGLDAANDWLIDLELQAARSASTSAEVVRDGILRLLGDGLLVDHAQTKMRIESDGLHVHCRGGWRPARLLGDGHYSTLAVVLDLLLRIDQFKPNRLLENMVKWHSESPIQIDFSGVVVIDEPESHLHPQLQQRLGFWFKHHFPKIQFIVTTHSPLVCQAAEPGGLFTMPKNGQLEPVDDKTWAQVANGTVDTAMMSKLFGLESSQSEDATLERRRLGKLNVKQMQGSLTAEEDEERQKLETRLPKDPDYQLDTLVHAFLKR